MTTQETHELFESIMQNIDELEEHMATLNSLLADNLQTKAKILQHLNNIIICDGCVDVEYDVFETIKNSLL